MDEEDYEKAKMLYDELKEMVSPGSNESKILKLDIKIGIITRLPHDYLY